MIRFAPPLLFVAAALLGGSNQGAVGLLVIGVLGASILALSLATSGPVDRNRSVERLAWALLVLMSFQLLPLPATIWEALPGRGLLADGDRLLGMSLVWRPLSLVPYQTLSSIAFLIAPLAMLLGVVRAEPLEREWLAWTLLGAALASALFASAQIGGVGPHLYAFTSSGPTGFFANTNHLATLMVAAIPFAGALASRRSAHAVTLRPLMILCVLLFLAITLLTGSIAMIALALPITAASMFIGRGFAFPLRLRPWLVSLSLTIAAAVTMLAAAGIVQGSGVSLASRLDIWRATLAQPSWMIAGTGFGTFQQVFQLGEDMFRADRFYVNHAHNDLLQLAVEGGLPALLLLVFFLGWWIMRAIDLVRAGAKGDSYARAGMLASGAILMHSLVDFPLRTEAIAVLFTLSLGLMARPASVKVAIIRGDLRETRHRKIG